MQIFKQGIQSYKVELQKLYIKKKERGNILLILFKMSKVGRKVGRLYKEISQRQHRQFYKVSCYQTHGSNGKYRADNIVLYYALKVHGQ